MGGIRIRQLFKSRKIVLAYCLGLFFILSAIQFTIVAYMHTQGNKDKLENAIKAEQYLLGYINNSLSLRVGRAVSDTLYLADSISRHLKDGQPLDDLTQDIISFCDHRQTYDHIRLIDLTGQELFRVNYYIQGSYSSNSLSLKRVPADLPLFSQTAAMNKHQVFISRMALFKEDGKLIRPIKPLISISTPLFTDTSCAGVLTAGYNAKSIVTAFKEYAAGSEGEAVLLNAQGFYLSNSSHPDFEFAFMFEDQQGMTFQTQQPQAWAQMQNGGSGVISTSDGYFIYITIVPYNGNMGNGTRQYASGYQLEEGNWLAVTHLSKEKLIGLGITESFSDMILYVLKSQWPAYLFTLLISAALSLLLVYGKISRDRIRYFSEYDSLTGALNRRAGIAMLEKSCREAVRDPYKISICFVDVDGLKQVNDELGHEKGDELLGLMVSGINQCIGHKDYVIRLGGDEFLIVFIKADHQLAEAAWQRIINEYQHINQTENRPYLISASHGIAEITPDVKQVIDEILNEADIKMYAEKRLTKIGLKVIREQKMHTDS